MSIYINISKMNKLGKILKKNECAMARLLQILICGILLLRLIGLAIKADCGDTLLYIHTSELIRQGISPYKYEVYMEYLNKVPPLQSPSMSLLSMPFSIFPEKLLCYLFFVASSVVFFIFIIMVLKYYGFNPNNYCKPYWRNVPIWFTIMLICISNPFLTILFWGQNSCFACLFLFWVLLYPKEDKKLNILLLSLAAAIKYSLMTFLVPVLIVQKRYVVSICAFVLFVFMTLSVGFWLDGPIESFVDYCRLLLKDTSNGFNSFKNVNLNFLFIGFFKLQIINVLLKIFLLVLYCLILLKKILNSKNDSESLMRLSATEWCLFAAMTLTISYHRIHDGILFLPFLGVIFLDSFYKMSFQKISSVVNVVISFSFLVFWSFPYKIMVKIASWIGTHFLLGEQFLYYPVEDTKLFPLLQIIMLFMICFLLSQEYIQLYVKKKEQSYI